MTVLQIECSVACKKGLRRKLKQFVRKNPEKKNLKERRMRIKVKARRNLKKKNI